MESVADIQGTRIYCTRPGIRNHNGTRKPVVTITADGLWAWCRWSKELEFIPKEDLLAAWDVVAARTENEISF